MTIKTERGLRNAFWASNPNFNRKLGTRDGRTVEYYKQNDYPARTRVAWCEFVDVCAKSKVISEELARIVTLG